MGVTVLASVFVFGLLVLFHEFGHFIMAKYTGMRVDEFAVGFGPRIASKKYGETVYSLRCVPLGGFNDIAGMDPGENDAGERGYSEKSVPERMMVILAGPLMNFVLPVAIFFMTFMTVGISTPSSRPELGEIIPERPAALAGLQKGDRIKRIGGREINVWDDIVKAVTEGGENPVKFELVRDGKDMSVTVIPKVDKHEQRPMIGATAPLDTRMPGVFEAASMSVMKTWLIIRQMVTGLVEIFTGSSDSAELAGPIGVAQMAGTVAKIGFGALLNFAALLSLNLGIINLLPIPALDGGHFVTLIVEALRGKPLGERALHYTQMAGITVLVLIMLLATKNDIVRIFSGG